MTVRAKFKCVEVAKTEQGTRVICNVVTNESRENEKFFKQTPSGNIYMGLLNEEAAKEFTPGREFYVDFTPVDEPVETIEGEM